jgi:tetratricopeptide (TPR) repeat protein
MMLKTLSLSLVLAGITAFAPASVSFAALSKDSASFYYQLGKAELANRRYSVAWQQFEKAALHNPADADLQLAIADVCTKMNRMAPAVKALETASKIRPNDHATTWKLVQLYFNYGQYARVLEILPGLHQRYSDTKGWAYMLGKSYQSAQNYGKAIEYMKQSLKDEPTNHEASYQIGRMMVQMANYKGAIPYYEASLKADTNQTNRMYELALVLATAEQFDASIQYFKMALERGYKARDDFYMNMAYTLADAHKSDEAVKMMKDMLSRRPEDLGLLSGLADVCYHSGRYKDAIGYWDQMLAADSKNARALYHIGLAYIKMGKDSDGKQLCDQAIAMDPSLGVLKHAKQMAF